jgi:hypothetical protein
MPTAILQTAPLYARGAAPGESLLLRHRKFTEPGAAMVAARRRDFGVDSGDWTVMMRLRLNLGPTVRRRARHFDALSSRHSAEP